MGESKDNVKEQSSEMWAAIIIESIKNFIDIWEQWEERTTISCSFYCIRVLINLVYYIIKNSIKLYCAEVVCSENTAESTSTRILRALVIKHVRKL